MDDIRPLPVTAVTLLEDRAQLTRTADVELGPGTRRLRLGPLTPLAVDRGLRAESATAGVTVLDVRLVRRWEPRPPSGPDADHSELARRVRELGRLLDVQAHTERRAVVRLEAVDEARAALHEEIAAAAGWGKPDPQRWARELAVLDAQSADHGDALARARSGLAELRSRHAEARHAMQRADRRPPEVRCELEVTVAAEQAGPARLEVVHLVPCALWRPAYRAELTDGDTRVRLETDAAVWQRTGEDWHGVALRLSTARPARPSAPPELLDDELVLRDRTAEERRTVEVGLREEDAATVGEDSAGAGATSAAPGLPGVDDGGETRLLDAPAPVDVPSDGQPHRIPLGAFEAPVRTERACAPELSPAVAPVARFANEGGRVLLAGPVDLVRGGGFGGRGELRFTGVGAPVRLAFGPESDYRVVRSVEEHREPSRLPGGRTVTTRTVRVFLSRLDNPDAAEPRTVVVRERIPVSEIDAVTVALRKDRCAPAPDASDADGIVTWTVTLAPAERRTLELVYDITAGAKVSGLAP
ncbi:hypothetical protein BIV57_19720 [Mangrovactinospora gilvigrisea]|uniref:Mucoidy inhibitor MuiA family protein n=1 Tax=Mangrovactinospora gilvigrisea TaxID=1428644 RepID=A0A1J7C2L2_9ACTN|nr:mucoidy inhibitor MuiA family protein [Mangrovactinospora gilvigrisea]OIV35800.1 hypothetical protein BIV57_19720 [Mangrovactinospora gilvigrisea]